MKLKGGVLNYLYLPVILLVAAVFLIVNGLTAWLGTVYLLLGMLFGWFLISVYLSWIKTSQASLILSSAFFQLSFLLFSFWLVVSNETLTASGIVLGVNLSFIKELVFDYQKRRAILKKKLFNNIEISDRFLLGYLVGFILLVALLTVLVIL